MNGQAGEEVVARGRSAIISHLIDIIQHSTPCDTCFRNWCTYHCHKRDDGHINEADESDNGDTAAQSSVADSNDPLGRVLHSHCTIERPDVIENVSKRVNHREGRVGEERGGNGPGGSEPGSLLDSELCLDPGHSCLNFRQNK